MLPTFPNRKIILGLSRSNLGNPETTHCRRISGINFDVRIQGARKRPLHITLPSAKPHFTDENILENLLLIPAGNFQVTRRKTRLHRLQRSEPFPLRIGRRTRLAITKFNLNFFSRFGPPPYPHRLVTLHHHVITKNMRNPQVSRQGGDSQKKNSRKQKTKTHPLRFPSSA